MTERWTHSEKIYRKLSEKLRINNKKIKVMVYLCWFSKYLSFVLVACFFDVNIALTTITISERNLTAII